MFDLTIGMATYNDFDGVYFTIQSLRMHQDCKNVEFIVVDNYGCNSTKNFVESWVPSGKYVLANEIQGTSKPRNVVFEEASGKAVMCIDCHVLFCPDSIARLKTYFKNNPDCMDLLQGPLVYDDLEGISTHFEPVWREYMWGIWETDPRWAGNKPFEIPMHGLGIFCCRKDAWLGFNEKFRGFGGEEGYIHEKFRKAGRKCLCLPWLRWVHRFARENGEGIKYTVNIEDRIRNYLIGHHELGLDLKPIIEHFGDVITASRLAELASEATGVPMSIDVNCGQ